MIEEPPSVLCQKNVEKIVVLQELQQDQDKEKSIYENLLMFSI